MLALHLIGTMIVGFAAGGIAWSVVRSFKLSEHRWITPAAVAAGMVAFQVYADLDETWFDEKRAELPETVVIAEIDQTPSLVHPWSYIWERPVGFTAVDTARIRPLAAAPELLYAESVLVRRTARPGLVLQIYDCAGGRRVAQMTEESIGPDGAPTPEAWSAVDASDPVRAVVCESAATAPAEEEAEPAG